MSVASSPPRLGEIQRGLITSLQYLQNPIENIQSIITPPKKEDMRGTNGAGESPLPASGQSVRPLADASVARPSTPRLSQEISFCSVAVADEGVSFPTHGVRCVSHLPRRLLCFTSNKRCNPRTNTALNTQDLIFQVDMERLEKGGVRGPVKSINE